MAFTIPNLAQATWEEQARLFSTDLTILGMSAGGDSGVISGCGVTAQTPEAMAVDVASGSIKLDGTQYAVSGNAVAITAANSSYPRLDVIYALSDGVAYVSTGTAAPDPVPNALPASAVGLAFVYVAADSSTVTSSAITDKRVSVAAPLGESQWTTVSKPSDTSRSSTTTLAADPHLVVPLAANTKYRIRASVLFSTPAATAGVKYGVSGPASPTFMRGMVHRYALGDSSMASAPSTLTSAANYFYSVYDDTTGVSYNATAASSLLLEWNFIVHNGPNTGDFEVLWTQATSSGSATTSRAGSWIEYEVA